MYGIVELAQWLLRALVTVISKSAERSLIEHLLRIPSLSHRSDLHHALRPLALLLLAGREVCGAVAAGAQSGHGRGHEAWIPLLRGRGVREAAAEVGRLPQPGLPRQPDAARVAGCHEVLRGRGDE